jgi:hypothetical protein
VTPAIKVTIGFPGLLALMNSAASSSAEPPISPIIMIPDRNVNIFVNSSHTLGFGVSEKEIKTVNKVSSVEGISSNSDTKRLSKTNVRSLEYGLISQSSGTRYNTLRKLIRGSTIKNLYLAREEI